MNEFIKSEEGHIVYKQDGFDLYSSFGYKSGLPHIKKLLMMQ